MRERFVFPKGAVSPLPRAVAVANDRAFEVAVLGEVRRELAAVPLRGSAPHVSLTPKSADRGRDIVIHGFSGDSLLGAEVESAPASRSVYIECKLSGRRRLTLDHAAANVLQLEPERGSIFLLVTNSTLTPRTASMIARQCERLDLAFLLVDAWNFAHALPALADPSPHQRESPPYLVSYQVLKEEGAGEEYLVHFVLRSLRPGLTRFEIALHSTRDWKASADGDGSFALAQSGIATWTLKLASAGPKIAASFSIALSIDGKTTSIG